MANYAKSIRIPVVSVVQARTQLEAVRDHWKTRYDEAAAASLEWMTLYEMELKKNQKLRARLRRLQLMSLDKRK